jgi:hypothetical protein
MTVRIADKTIFATSIFLDIATPISLERGCYERESLGKKVHTFY